MIFKCRCMPFVSQRLSITMLMNGAYKSMSHMSLTSLTRPYGLHRKSYLIMGLDRLSDGDCDVSFQPVVRRRPRYLDNFKNNFTTE